MPASYEVTPFIGAHGADHEDRHRLAAGDEHHTSQRPHRGHAVHVQGARGQRRGPRPAVRRLQRGDADGVRPRPARPPAWRPWPTRARPRCPGTRPANDGGSAITGYRVTAVHRTPTRRQSERRRVGEQRECDRAHQRHELHVPRAGDQRPRARAPSRPPATRWSRRARSSTSRRRRPRGRQRRQRRAARREVPQQCRGYGDRRPLLQGEPPTPAPTSAACGRPPASCSAQATFSGESASGLAEGDVRDTGGDRRPTPRTWPATTRRTGITRSRPRRSPPAGWRTRRCRRSPTTSRRTACTSTQAWRRSRRTPSMRAITGWTSCSTRDS